MPPGALAAGAVIDGSMPHHAPGKELIAGQTMLLYIARGEGTYRVHNRSGLLRPNTLVAAPAGAFACELSDEREMYVVALRDTPGPIGGKPSFSPFIEHRFSELEGRRWKDRMAEFTDRAAAGRADADDVERLKEAVYPYVWRREPNGARDTLTSLFMSIWQRLGEPLTLDGLAGDVGYTANYLNDLTRDHTGRPLGSWITDMRMSRARAALEHTDLPVAEIGATCGYDDPAYFSRAFRRVHGVPPAMWRIAMRPVDERHNEVAIPLDTMHEMEMRGAMPQPAYSFAS